MTRRYLWLSFHRLLRRCGLRHLSLRFILITQQPQLTSLQYHIRRDRCRGPSTVSTTLNHHRDRKRRTLERGDRDEPAIRSLVHHRHLVILILSLSVPPSTFFRHELARLLVV